MKDIYALLEENNLSRTPCRVEILKTLSRADSALSESEIRDQLAYNYDRTTVYRTLRNFLSQNVIHSIALEGGEVRYAMTPSKDKPHNSHHVHFYCNNCNGVFCISHKPFETPELPNDFQPESFDLLVHGKCKNCTK
jgi:Fur family ferric uptake transcriptional regulator